LPDQSTLEIYTDGSSRNHPRRGGIGIRYISTSANGDEKVDDLKLPGYKNASNNQMELQAAILALEGARIRGLLKRISRVFIRTDSLYLVENYRKAMFEWPKTKWLLQSGKPVLNAELWKRLTSEIHKAQARVEVTWVKGHSRDPHNIAVDRLAKESGRAPLKPALSYVSVRRKKTSESVQIGSVEMKAQRISIRIVTCEYLKTQKLWKLKYEVISKESPFKGRVDIIYSSHLLKDGHCYYVKVNKNNKSPTIIRVFKELAK